MAPQDQRRITTARESLFDRVTTRLFGPGYGAEMSFLFRYDWAVPTVVIGGIAAVLLGGLWALWSADWGRPVLIWGGIIGGAGTVLLLAWMFIDLRRSTRGPLPALDRTARTARVEFNGDDGEHHALLMRYRGADGHKHSAQLADAPAEDWINRFAPGSRWQIYAFQHPRLADTVVFLTEAHEEVWRAGYVLDRIRLGTERGTFRPHPGSPFLREGSKWRFEA